MAASAFSFVWYRRSYVKKAQQKLVIVLYKTKQKFDLSIVVLVSFIVVIFLEAYHLMILS